MTHLHAYTKTFFRLLRGIQPRSKFKAHFFFYFPKQTFAGAALPGSSPNEDPPPHPARPSLASGHLSAGRNSRPCDGRVLAPVSQQGTRRCSGTEIHAQHSAGMPRSTASPPDRDPRCCFWWKKKKMRRGARERSGGCGSHLMEGTGAASGL